MRRLLLLAGLALALAAVLLATGATAKPPPGHGKLAKVSAGLPYVAPWQSGFRRYSTQLITPRVVSFAQWAALIPDGQWWRVVYVWGQWSTSAVAGTRSVFFRVWDPVSGTFSFQTQTPLAQAASAAGTYLFGPGLTSFAVSTDPLVEMGVATLPDLLWPPGKELFLGVASAKAGDAWATGVTFAVEVYTPEKEGSPVLVPMPLVS